MPPTNWQPATIVNINPETPTAKTFRLRLNHPSTHLPGQHYIVKLTDPSGYSASRSNSVASAPDGSTDIELTIDRELQFIVESELTQAVKEHEAVCTKEKSE